MPLPFRFRDPISFWSWIRDGKYSDPVTLPFWPLDPGWTYRIIFPRASEQFLGFIKILKFFYADPDPGSGIFLTLDPGWNSSDPGSGINIPDPYDWFYLLEALCSVLHVPAEDVHLAQAEVGQHKAGRRKLCRLDDKYFSHFKHQTVPYSIRYIRSSYSWFLYKY